MCQKPLFACVITLLMLPSMWYITVIGFIDVAGVVVALGCYYLYMTKVLNSRKYLKYILLGVMLAFIMIIRRYFAFFTVSFVTVMIIETILFSRKFKELFITLLSLGFVLVVLFYPFFTNILLKDYGALYSSYKYSFATDLKLITGIKFCCSFKSCDGVRPYRIIPARHILRCLSSSRQSAAEFEQ